jgi:hypothetical protein
VVIFGMNATGNNGNTGSVFFSMGKKLGTPHRSHDMGCFDIELVAFFNFEQGAAFLQGKTFNALEIRSSRIFKLRIITGRGVDGFFANFNGCLNRSLSFGP